MRVARGDRRARISRRFVHFLGFGRDGAALSAPLGAPNLFGFRWIDFSRRVNEKATSESRVTHEESLLKDDPSDLKLLREWCGGLVALRRADSSVFPPSTPDTRHSTLGTRHSTEDQLCKKLTE